MIPKPEEVIAEISALGRYSLELEFTFVSHRLLTLRVFSKGADKVYLTFSDVDSIDIPTMLTNVKLNFSFRNQEKIPTFELVCEEGIFSIKAKFVTYRKGDKYQEARDWIEKQNSLPLWEDGVSVEDLSDWLVKNDY
jgi:hypothetical protein